MIEKIISGGQSGVERAALDAAIKEGVAYGGRVPKWRKEEDKALTEMYHLEEMVNDNYARTTEQNVLDSDGTLIISRGELTAGPAMNRRLAERHKRPLLYIDLNRLAAFQAAEKIGYWITENHIRVLNVTGPIFVENCDIYKTSSDILETVFQMLFINAVRSDPLSVIPDTPPQALDEIIDIPRSVEQAADMLLSRLTFGEKTRIANMTEGKLPSLIASLGVYVKNEFRLWDKDLPSSSKDMPDDPGEAIILTVWKKLQKSESVLRVVK